MDSESTPRWLCGTRRLAVEFGALERYVQDWGITGTVWTPSAVVVDDYAEPLLSLVESGARPDGDLLYDFQVVDVRTAAEDLSTVWRDSARTDGWSVFWVHPDKLRDVGRAVEHISTVLEDCFRPNVAIGFAWSQARAGVLSALTAAGVTVAVSGANRDEVVEQVARAHDKGMQRAQKEAEAAGEEPEQAAVYLLGSTARRGDWIRPVRLVTELGVVTGSDGRPPRLPATQEEETQAFDRAVAHLAVRSQEPLTDDHVAPDEVALAVSKGSGELDAADTGLRLWTRDPTLWAGDPAEITDRLGWLELPETMRAHAEEISSFARSLRASGTRTVVLLGMGGSSLAPEVLRSCIGGDIPLVVLDSTHPDHLKAVTSSLDLATTTFVVASKSGTTTETMAHLEHFWSLSGSAERFVAITDPQTPLGTLADERRFRKVFRNPADIGGRYSALSYFGLVPSAVCGIDVDEVLGRAARMMRMCTPSVPADESPGMRLGVLLGNAHGTGRDKLTLVLPPRLAAFGGWVEQLVAESTGKAGTGILPVDAETLGTPDVYGPDRLFVAYAVDEDPFPEALETLEDDHPVVRIWVPDTLALGAEMYRWEVAIAVAGSMLRVNPFDQPDVESAKQRTRQMLDGQGAGDLDRGSAAELLDGLQPPAYVAIQAFLPPTHEHVTRLQAVRMRLRDHFRVATTVGFGPRFLHSTGQLHKGGPDTGVFVQVTGDHESDVDIPGKPYTFGRLIDAQADGDLLALRDAGRRVARVTLDELERLELTP